MKIKIKIIEGKIIITENDIEIAEYTGREYRVDITEIKCLPKKIIKAKEIAEFLEQNKNCLIAKINFVKLLYRKESEARYLSVYEKNKKIRQLMKIIAEKSEFFYKKDYDNFRMEIEFYINSNAFNNYGKD